MTTSTMNISIFQTPLFGQDKGHELVFGGSVKANGLDDVFCVFNPQTSEEFEAIESGILKPMRSLSVGDVVRVDYSDSVSFYKVMLVGFAEIDPMEMF